MEILTNSSLRTFRECPKKYNLRYEQGYETADTPEYFRFGTIWHLGLYAWHKGGKSLEDALVALNDEVQGNEDKYLCMRLFALMEGYHEKYKDEPYEAIEMEKEFSSPVINPETGRESKTLIYKGILDALYKDAHGRILLKESKTTSDDISPASDYWLKLGLDSQISGYYIGAEVLGFPIEFCLYDVVRKFDISPKKATPIEHRKYKADGTLYAAQRDKDETPQEFYERCRGEIELRPDHYYARREVPRSPNDIAEHMFDVWNTGKTLYDHRKNDRWPRNTNSCITITHKCEFWKYCVGQASLEDTNLFKKSEQKHRELTPEPNLERVERVEK